MPVGHLSPSCGGDPAACCPGEQTGNEVWREFDVVMIFGSEEEARDYADRNAIEDIEL
jgi:hypothetical protein